LEMENGSGSGRPVVERREAVALTPSARRRRRVFGAAGWFAAVIRLEFLGQLAGSGFRLGVGRGMA